MQSTAAVLPSSSSTSPSPSTSPSITPSPSVSVGGNFESAPVRSVGGLGDPSAAALGLASEFGARVAGTVPAPPTAAIGCPSGPQSGGIGDAFGSGLAFG